MTSLYPCNPHYTSRSPEGESLEVTGLKMLLTPLTNTWTRDCRAPALYQNAVIILPVCPSVRLSAGSLSYASPYQAKVPRQKLQGRESLPKSKGQRKKKARSKSLLGHLSALTGYSLLEKETYHEGVFTWVFYRRLHQLAIPKNSGTGGGGEAWRKHHKSKAQEGAHPNPEQ